MSYQDNLKKFRQDPQNYILKPQCIFLWSDPIIHWNGDILGCCINYNGVFSKGNKNFTNILERMNSKYLIEIRKILLDELPLEVMSRENPCYNCYTIREEVIFSSIKKYIQALYKGKSILTSEDMTAIRLEFTTSCQLKCPGCWRNSLLIKNIITQGYLKPNDLKTLLEDSGLNHLKLIICTANGESLLNPHFVELLKICYDHNIQTSADTGFNLNHITDEQIEVIVDTKMPSIILSIDGASQETYSKYRVGGNFDKVIENIKRLQAYKQKVGSEYPELLWRMIIFNWNIHEIDTARKMAKDLGIDFTITKNNAPFVDTLTPENEHIYQEQRLNNEVKFHGV